MYQLHAHQNLANQLKQNVYILNAVINSNGYHCQSSNNYKLKQRAKKTSYNQYNEAVLKTHCAGLINLSICVRVHTLC